MYQSHIKREQFHNQIRQKQHEQIFKKIRTATTIDYKTNITITQSLQPLLNKLPKMYQLSSNIEGILDHQLEIAQFIGQIRKFQDNEAIVVGSRGNDVFWELLGFLLHVAGVIHGHMIMDIEGYQIYQEQYAEREAMYCNILLPIGYLLINLTSQELPLRYLETVGQFTKYRAFIDTFHNIFISQNLTIQLKEGLLDQFIGHLEKYPMFTLNNCNTFIKILYCGFVNSPSMLANSYKQYQLRAIRVLQKLHSVLEFSNKLTQANRTECRQYTWIVLHKLCSKSQANCCEAVNSVSLIRSIQDMIAQLRYYFLTKGKFDEDFCDESLVAGLTALVNLTYFDDVAYSLNQCFPTIWINLMTIFQRLTIQTWVLENGNNKNLVLPPIFQTPNFTTIVLKTLKCISNFICVPQICQYFVVESKENKKIPWYEVLTEIYNDQYKSTQIRVQCLCILSNSLLIVSRQQTQSIRNEYNEDISQEPSLYLKILNSSADLLMQVLKLHNTNKNIIISVLKTILLIVEQNPQCIKKCHLFQNHSFINRLTSIAEKNTDFTNEKQHNFEEYSDDVRLQAQYLLEAYMISSERI